METKKQVEEKISQQASSTGAAASSNESDLDIQKLYSEVNEEDKKNLAIWMNIEEKIKELEKLPRNKKGKAAKDISTEHMLDLINLAGGFFNKYEKLKPYFDKLIQEQLVNQANADIRSIQSSATQYFQTLYPSAKFTFKSKLSGVQMGQIVDIGYLNNGVEEKVSYYIKTHQGGSVSASGSSLKANNVDLKELFIYKVLENLGIGPKAHFFPNILSGQSGFCIATRGIPTPKKAAGKEKKTFFTYDNVVEKKGGDHFRKISRFEDLKEKEEIFPGFAKQDFILEMTKIDILAKTLLITDLNSGNFGFVFNEDKMKKCKIVDFRAPENQGSYLIEKTDLVADFLKGKNTEYGKIFSSMVLSGRAPEEKIASAVAAVMALNTNKSGDFNNAIDKALLYVIDCVQKNSSAFGNTIKAQMDDINRYSEGIKINLATLCEGLTEVNENITNSSAENTVSASSSSKPYLPAYGTTLKATANAITNAAEKNLPKVIETFLRMKR